MMNTTEALKYLDSLEFFGIKLGLEQTSDLFRRIGDPQLRLRFIHVAGSNGKGSVCAYVEAALRASGYKTGFYSSPHLVRTGERFQVNGVPCSDERLAGYINRIAPHVRDMAAEGRKVTYFEFTTAIAALFFAEEQVDFAVWETGMGGRLDSTNIVTPIVSVITGISLEHKQYLGDTLEKIAFEKAGIVKPGVPVFCSRGTPEAALDVIRTRAEELHAPFQLAAPLSPEQPVCTVAEDYSRARQTFSLANGETLSIPLMGPHQRLNAALAFSVVHYLSAKYQFKLDSALRAFATTSWPARFQFIPSLRLIIDAAHNPEGLTALAASLRETFPHRRFHFIFGAFTDKDAFQGLALLAPLALSFRFIHMDTMRASRSADELESMLLKIAPGLPSGSADLTAILHPRGSEDDWNVLCGSLHLCGDALGLLERSL